MQIKKVTKYGRIVEKKITESLIILHKRVNI